MPVQLDSHDLPPDKFDKILSKIDISFRVGFQSEVDCIQNKNECTSDFFPEPVIDYMAKDFASFRRLMLDRLFAIMPDWKERNPSDLGVAIVELLAYVGDHLSYFQDAVGTEAYLGTARKRVSVKRHARLLDYFIHEGCNARAWVCFELKDKDNLPIPRKTTLLTGDQALFGNYDTTIVHGIDDFNSELTKGAEAFETMHDVILYQTHNEIEFYTWGDCECCLPKGSTRATLRGDSLIREAETLFKWKQLGSTTKCS